MRGKSQRELELRELLIAANSDEASDEQLARLDELIRSDRELAKYAAEILDQQATLAWRGSVHDQEEEAFACPLLKSTEAESADTSNAPRRETRREGRSLSSPTIAVGIAFLLGGLTVLLSSQLAWPLFSGGDAGTAVTSPENRPYEARLTGSTNCLWEGDSLVPRQVGSWLSSGESVHLREGLAEFELNWALDGHAAVSLEGPAAMMLSSEGMPTLRFGRLTATIITSQQPFVLDTPVGRLILKSSSSIGISSFGNEGEISVFNGSAILEPAWRSPDQTLPLEITAGHAIRIQTGENGESKIGWHSADAEYFTAQVSMSSDNLTIPAAYVDAVKKAKPIGYWRFDRDSWPKVPNVMGPEFECRVSGELGRATYPGNQAVEFGVTGVGGEIICDEILDDIIVDTYSVEFWVKPSHYHLGSMVSLVGGQDPKTGNVQHGVLVELGGTGRIPTAIQHPGRIRFLHRNPPSQTRGGTSCYSDASYTLRKWQHVVATKEKAKMRLYVDGDLVAEGSDSSRLPTGLRLLVGKLDPSRIDNRPFIGQFDELALYDRALESEEIHAHFELVQPAELKMPLERKGPLDELRRIQFRKPEQTESRGRIPTI